MEGGITTASLKELLRFPFRERDWESRFLLGALLVFVGLWVPVLPWVFVCGYLLRVMRQVVKGEEPGLVTWEDWGGLGLDGLRAMAVNLVYLLPGMLIFGGGIALYMSASVVFPFLAEGGKLGEGLMVTLFLLAMAIFFLSLFVGSVLFLLGLIPMPVALAHLAASDELPAAFRVREWWGVIRSDPLGYFVAWTVLFGLGSMLYIGIALFYYTGVLCCLLPILTAPVLFYLGLIGAALFGQFYREHTAPPSS